MSDWADSLLFLNATFADDVRQEVANKYSVLGIYHSALLVPKFPTVLAKFCVLFQLSAPIGKAIDSVTFTLHQDDAILQQIEAEISRGSWDGRSTVESEPHERLLINAVVQFAPLNLEKPCNLRARAVLHPNEEKLRGGSLKVGLMPTSVNSPLEDDAGSQIA